MVLRVGVFWFASEVTWEGKGGCTEVEMGEEVLLHRTVH